MITTKPKNWEFKGDTYFDFTRCAIRLFEEWKKHPKLIIACDFDDTIYDFHKKGQDHSRVIQLLKECQAIGFYIVIFTASEPAKHDFIKNYCAGLGVNVDSINKNPIDLPYGNWGKIYYNHLLDDRSGLKDAYTILSAALGMIKGNMMDQYEKEAEATKESRFIGDYLH